MGCSFSSDTNSYLNLKKESSGEWKVMNNYLFPLWGSCNLYIFSPFTRWVHYSMDSGSFLAATPKDTSLPENSLKMSLSSDLPVC